jgi:hypothetical protein
VPQGSIVTPNRVSSDSCSEPLFDFDVVKNYIIPKGPLCNRLLTLKVDQYRLVGYPVQITASHYARNSFSFNFCFVFNYENDTLPYESAIRRLGRMFKNLEEQYQILSKKENDIIYFKNVVSVTGTTDQANDASSFDDHLGARSSSMDSSFAPSVSSATYNQIVNDLDNNIKNSSTPIGVSTKGSKVITLESIESLIQQIYQDLNNYSECLIPVDSGNSVDIKLLPLLPPPPRVYPEDVPISTVQLKTMVDANWDPTMLKILPYIDGINSIKRISLLADADYWVVKICIQHLMYYRCITISDIFQFSNIYAPTSDIDLFLKDNHMAAECQAYVVSASQFQGIPYAGQIQGRSSDTLSNTSIKRDSNVSMSLSGKQHVVLPSKAKLFYLYRSLHQGQMVKNWYKEHATDLEFIDIRRFLTFGVLRGLIYRIQSFPLTDSVPSKEDHQQDSYFASFLESGTSISTPRELYARRTNSSNLSPAQRDQITELTKLLQSTESFDSICTQMNLDKKSVETLLRHIGPVNVVNS